MLLSSCVVLLGGGESAPAQSGDENPLAGLRFYVDQESSSMEQWRALERSGQHSRADLVWKIAREPKAVWVGRFTSPNFHVKVRRIFDNAHAQGAVPILTVLRAQSTGCSPTYDGGGPAEDARTRAWYDDLARAIGVAKVRGFMLNATHYDWTINNIRFGLEVSRRTGGKHFVINTAENGRGPIHYRLSNGRRINVWCNPGLRGLGPRPTTDTSHPMVDAYLWINRPGFAQSCQHRPIAWYPARALTYARYATDWERPPAGTKFGHFKRYSLRTLGVRR